MKKRILSLLCVLAMLLSMTAFANAAVSSDITDAADYKSKNLKGNNLVFSALVTGGDKATFTVDGKALESFYYDSDIRFYTFTFNNLTVRTDKNNFFDLNLKSAAFELTERSFNVTYTYNNTSTKKIDDVNLDMRYTVKGAQFSKHTVAIMGDKTVFCKDSKEDSFVFLTNKLGAFTPVKFEFTDVKDSGKWYYTYVNQAGAYGIVSGVGDGTFVPTRNVTRAELATLMVEATKHIINYDTGKKPSFEDVKEGAWYYEYVTKCASKGLMNGVGGGLFNPTATATRQEIAEVTANLVRLLGRYNGKDLPQINKDTIDKELSSVFADSKSIHSWAKESVLLCQKLAIMEGADGFCYPTRQITRAECAKIFSDLYFMAAL